MNSSPSVSRGRETGSRRRPFRYAGLVCLLLSLALDPALLGQSVYGKILGTVSDNSGKPLSGVVLTATSEEKGTQFHTRSDQRGHYEFPQLLRDTYNVRAQAGDREMWGRGVSVSVAADSVLDLTLPAAGHSGTVVGGSTLSTRTDNSITIDRNEIASLPNYDQNSTRFGLLAPGVAQQINPAVRGTGNISSQDPQNVLQLTMNGQLPSGTALVLDGTDNRDSINQLAVFNSTLESLGEIRIVSQSFDAETGQALSGVVIAQTRSGGNTWHGSAFEFRRSGWGEASSPNLQNATQGISPEFKVNLFGGSLGGPILRNRLFIFGDYQGTRRALGSTQVLNVPSQTVRDTCLSSISQVCDLSEYLQPNIEQIVDPTTGANFKCGTQCITPDRLSPQALSLLSLLPRPNFPTSMPGFVANYKVAGAEEWNDNVFDIRIDENLSAKVSLFGRYSFAGYHINSPSAFGNLVGGPGFGPDGFAGQGRSPNHSLSVGVDYALQAGFFTDFRFGFFRRKITALPNSYNTAPATDANLIGLNLDTLSSGMPSILIQQPSLSVGGSNINYGDGQNVNQCNCPLFETLQQFQWVNNWVLTRGNHFFKWGEDFRFAEDNSFVSPSRRAGLLSFAPKDTGIASDQKSGLGLATFLIGDVSTFSRSLGTTTNAGVHQKRLFFYGQDNWRVTPRFTLNYGLRWEIYFPQNVKGTNLGGYLNLNTGMIQSAGSGGVNLAGNVGHNWHNLAPRVGFAFQLNPKTVLRAAYGRNFDAGTSFTRSMNLNPPVLIGQALQATRPCMPPECNSVTPPAVACVSCVFQFSASVPPPPAGIAPSGAFDLPPQVSASALPNVLKVPTLDQWNLTVEHEVGSNLSFALSYVGNKATHVLPSGPGGAGTTINLNQSTIAGFATNSCFLAANAQMSKCLDRYPYYEAPYSDTGMPRNWTQPITYSAGVASANYNGLQAKLVKRFSRGYEFNAYYTWAKGISCQSDYFAQDPTLNRGVNLYDRTHTFIFYNVLDLPFGRGRPFLGSVNRAANNLIGGWSVNTITTWSSGLPFSPTYDPRECTHDRDTGPCRPNLVGTVQITGDRNNYFTTTGGHSLSSGPNDGSAPGGTIGPWQRPAVGTFGTAGFNSMHGPQYFGTDLVLEKNLAFTERYSLQFRTEFLNVFNRVNLGNPNGCVDCATNGGVITTLAPNASQREVEFSLRLRF